LVQKFGIKKLITELNNYQLFVVFRP